MLRKPTLTLLSVLAFAGGILGTSSAALADPPWARGGRSYGRSRYDAGPRYGRYGY